MQKTAKNKMVTGEVEENKTTLPVEEQYFFPDYGVTVSAVSKEEAEKKAKKLYEEKNK